MRKLGEIEAALVEYDCPKVLQYVQELPVKLQDLGYILVAAARAYFEQQQYALAVETFKKCRERAPHWIRGMEYYSTALWHLHRESELSALAQDLTENFKMSSEVIKMSDLLGLEFVRIDRHNWCAFTVDQFRFVACVRG